MTFREQAFFFTMGAAAATELIGVFTSSEPLATGGLIVFALTGLAGAIAIGRAAARRRATKLEEFR